LSFRTVSVIGLGYIGLPTAAVMAERGVRVIGVDVNPSVVEMINRGEVHIVEPALDRTVRNAVASKALTASLKPVAADAFIIAVPTPMTADKRADMRFVQAATASIAPVLKAGDLVVLESTSPIGSTRALATQLAALRRDLRFPGDAPGPVDVNIAYCPERVIPGKVIEELVSNDRAVGGLSPACTERAVALYKLFVGGDVVRTDATSAELCKLTENAFRDVNIAFANELANVCDHVGADVWEVIRLANRHPRVNVLRPGIGVGGHCIAIDPWFIVEAAPESTPLIRAARRVNDARPERVTAALATAARDFSAQTGRRPTIALLGLSFKPNIDDLRESPAVEIVHSTAAQKIGRIVVVEPHIDALPEALQKIDVEIAPLDAALRAADIVALLVDHTAFAQLDPAATRGKLILSFCREDAGAAQQQSSPGRADAVAAQVG
jgi:UDP-N-acetyl-D-mannosaminuronic acid dehydrogenase